MDAMVKIIQHHLTTQNARLLTVKLNLAKEREREEKAWAKAETERQKSLREGLDEEESEENEDKGNDKDSNEDENMSEPEIRPEDNLPIELIMDEDIPAFPLSSLVSTVPDKIVIFSAFPRNFQHITIVRDLVLSPFRTHSLYLSDS